MAGWLDEAQPAEEAAPATGWKAEAVDLEAERQGRIARLGDIMASLKSPDERAAVLDISRKTGAPPDLVESQLPFWKSLAESATDPEDFYTRNPELAAIALDQPWVGEIVTKDKPLSTLQKVLGRVVGERPATEAEQIQALEQGVGPITTTQVRSREPFQKVALEKGPVGDLQGMERVTGHWETIPSEGEYLDPYTGEVTPAGTPVLRQTVPSIYGYRAARSTQSTDLGMLGLKWSAQVLAGGDGYEHAKRAAALRNAPEQDLQAGPVEEVFLGVADLAGSELISTGTMLVGTGVGASVGGPAGAVVGNRVGAGLSFGTSFVQEYSNVWDFADQRDDEGRPVDRQVAIGAAISYATLAAAIETGVNLGPWKALVGPLGSEGVKVEAKAFLKQIAVDPAKRAVLAKVAKQWATTAVAEGGEETVQGILSDLFGWYTRSRSAGMAEGGTFAPQAADPVASIGENLDVGVQVALSTAIIGAPAGARHYVSTRREIERSRVAERQLAAITHAIPDSPTAKGAPEAFVAAVQAETAASGEVVRAAHIDPAGINRLAQEANVDPVEMIREALGNPAVWAYQEAVATGQKIEVPLEEYVTRWHQSGLADALLPDTTTRAFGVPTPRQREEQAKEVAEEVKRLVDEVGSEKDQPTPSEALFTQMAKELAAAGKLKASAVEPQVKLWRKFVRTEAGQNGLDVETVARDLVVKVARAQADVPAVQALTQPYSEAAQKFWTETKAQAEAKQADLKARLGDKATTDPLYLQAQRDVERAAAAMAPSRMEQGRRATDEDFAALKDALRKAHPGVDFSLTGGSGGVVVLASVKVKEDQREKGFGSAFMADFVKMADERGLTLALTPSSDFGGTKSRLVTWNKRFGFVENKGRTKDLAISETMYRPPASRREQPGQPMQGKEVGSTVQVRGWLDTVKQGSQRLASIFLTEKADLSTFLHESAHAFWELKADLAEAPLAPQLQSDAEAVARKEKARADLQAALDFMGVKDRAELDARAAEATAIRAGAKGRDLTPEEKARIKELVEPFEKWARGFEAYLMEGKSPSLSLAGAFRTFRHWLTDIYKSLRSLRVDLTPEIRGVFDRMLATDAEIAATGRAIGIDGPALEEAKSRAEIAALKDVQRATEAWWQSELVKALKEAEDSYAQLPEVVNNDLLRRGREAGLDGLPAKQPVPPRKEWVKNQADAIMAAKHPGILEERARLLALVERALHEEPSVVDELHRQWAEDRKKAGKGETSTEAIRQAAKVIVGRQLTQQIDPRRYYLAERAEMRARAKAEGKGDWAAAAMASQRRLLNFYLYREALAAKDQIESIQELAGKLVSEKGQERLGRASPVFRDFANRLLGASGLVNGVPETQVGMTDLTAEFQKPGVDLEPDFDLDVVNAILAKPMVFDDLTVDQMAEVDNALKQIRRAARNRMTVKVGNQRVSLDALVGDIRSEASRLPAKAPPPEAASQPNENGGWATIKGFLDSATDPLTTFLDDDYLGPTARAALRDRYYAQRNVEHELLGLVAVKVAAALDGMSPEMRAGLYNEVDRSMLPRFSGQRRGGKVDRTWMLLLLANLGNKGNMERLLGGRGWTMEQVQEFFRVNKLTAEEARFIEGLWAINDRHLWPRIVAVHEAVNGTKPQKVEARPVILTLADGKELTLTGGYWPAMADPKESELGKKQEDVTTANEANYDQFRATLLKGFTKRRAASAKYVVRLDDFGAYPAHVLKVIRYIAYEEFVRDAGRILDKIRPAVEERIGGSAADQIDRWLKVVASGSPDSVSTVERHLVRIIGFLKSRTVRTAMLLNLKNAMADLTNPLLTMVGPRGARVRPDYLIGAALQATGGLVVPTNMGPGFWSMLKEAREQSDEIRLRHDGAVQRVREQFDRFGAGGRRWRPLGRLGINVEPGRLVDWIGHHGFIFQHVVEVFGTTLAWHAAKRQALARGASEQEARRKADDIIQKNWNSGLPAEQSALLRSRGAAGALMMMQGFFNRMMTKSRQTLHPAMVEWANAEGWTEKGKASLTVAEQGAMLMGIWFVINVLGSALEGRGPEEGEDVPEWVKRKMMSAPLLTIPLLNEAAPFIEAEMASDAVKGKLRYSASERASPAVSSALRIMKSLGAIAADETEDSKRFWSSYEVAAFALGLPVAQVKRTGTAAWDWATDPAADFGLEQLIYGNNPRAPGNVFDMMEDGP